MKVGVIGMGSIGKRHAKNIKKLDHTVIGYDPLKLKEWPDDGSIWEADAFVIASPISTHADYISMISPDKPIFVEKPIADRMIYVPDNVLMVGYNLRFHQCVQTVKGWILAGYLGEPIWANFVVAQKNNKYSESVVFNWSHEIDLALYLLGPANLLNYRIRVDPVTLRQTLADLHLFNSNGCNTTVHLDYMTAPEIRQSIIVGKDATIITDLLNRQAWIRDTKGNMLDHFVGNDTWDSNYLDEIESFIARCNGEDTVGCTAKEALDVVEICLLTTKPSRSH